LEVPSPGDNIHALKALGASQAVHALPSLLYRTSSIPEVISLYANVRDTLVVLVHASSLLIIIDPVGSTVSSPIVSLT
jgi:hypothetical protein